MPSIQKQKLYRTSLDLTEDDFEMSWIKGLNHPDYRPAKNQLTELHTFAMECAGDLHRFSWERFERRYLKRTTDNYRIEVLFRERMELFREEHRFSTASTYQFALRSFGDFLGSELKHLTLDGIDVAWLEKYEAFMLESGRSLSTIGIYLRTLRSVYRNALESGDITENDYPFGRGKYAIPTVKGHKKALNREQLQKLYHCIPKTSNQKKARAFWFFSYVCNGMSIRDILLLKHSDLIGDHLIYYPSHPGTGHQEKSEPVPVYLSEYAESILLEYRGGPGGPDDYLFPVLSRYYSPQEKEDLIRNFNRFVNQHIKTLALSIGLPTGISTYWARHSFATASLQQGGDLRFLRESLGHSSIRTTKEYLSGFDAEFNKKMSVALMGFVEEGH